SFSLYLHFQPLFLSFTLLFPYTTLFRSALTEETDDSGLELVHVQLGGVDDQVGLAPDRKQGLSFASDPVGDASVTLQWVWSAHPDRNSTRLNSSHVSISYAVFCLNYLYM